MSPTRLTQVPALDGVRGLALAAVMVHHVTVRSDHPPIRGAWLSVDLFFALSGFLITLSVIEHPNVGEFFRRRFWRLAPAMAVFLAIYVAWSLSASDAHQRMRWALAAATQWANIQGAIGPPFSPHIGHLWSLSAEVQFYVVWGLVLSWLVRGRVAPRTIVSILSVLFVVSWIERVVLWERGTPWNRLYLGPDTHGASLLVGCIVGLAFASGWLPPLRRALTVATVPSVAFFAWGIVELSFLDGRVYLWGLTAVAVASGVIVASAAMGGGGVLKPLLELRPLRFLGRISYSVYLWHLPIIAEVARRRAHGDIGGIALIALPLSLVVGWVSYVAIERPLLSSAGRARLRARLGT
ncbi:MAG: hypothetical protein QOI47_2124 [Actinomycetota bacterium]|nr:hypothetical protein [Actinomycetota bacterium]